VSQAITVADDVVLSKMLNVNVAVFTQPEAFNDVYV
jgi:hypothetical protein